MISRPWRRAAASLFTLPVARYITAQRDRLSETAAPLTPALRVHLASYFAASDLDRVRIIEADPLPIPDPPLEQQIRRLGFAYPSLSSVAAITFDHVIASREPATQHLLFHELVHVVQYRMLGVRTFAHLYVKGFLSSGAYEEIPLELCAFQLEERFVCERSPFDVEREIAEWIEAGRF